MAFSVNVYYTMYKNKLINSESCISDVWSRKSYGKAGPMGITGNRGACLIAKESIIISGRYDNGFFYVEKEVFETWGNSY